MLKEMITTINEFRKVNENRQHKIAVASSFSLEEKQYAGWTFGDQWNGFGVPYFEKSVADEIVKDINEMDEDGGNVYIPGEDAYDFIDDDKYKGMKIVTTDGEKHVYPIGAFMWTWHEDK